MELRRKGVCASLRPDVGAAITRLEVQGINVFAQGATHPPATPVPLADENAWVKAWSGGWQPALPNTGQPAPNAVVPQGFHGNASQEAWTVASALPDRAVLRWRDAGGLEAVRHYRLLDNGITARTELRNMGTSPREVQITEHLVLGSDLLSHPLTLNPGPAASIEELEYDGSPSAAKPMPWPGKETKEWSVVSRDTPARVAVLRETLGRMQVKTDRVGVTLRWDHSLLPYMWLWEEIGATQESPWNGETFALGVEPSSVPAALGLDDPALKSEAIVLNAAASLSWWVDLAVTVTDGATPLTASELEP